MFNLAVRRTGGLQVRVRPKNGFYYLLYVKPRQALAIGAQVGLLLSLIDAIPTVLGIAREFAHIRPDYVASSFFRYILPGIVIGSTGACVYAWVRALSFNLVTSWLGGLVLQARCVQEDGSLPCQKSGYSVVVQQLGMKSIFCTGATSELLASTIVFVMAAIVLGIVFPRNPVPDYDLLLRLEKMTLRHILPAVAYWPLVALGYNFLARRGDTLYLEVEGEWPELAQEQAAGA